MGFNIERVNKPFVVKSPYKPSGDKPKANEELAAMVRAETTDALNKVLFELSSGMKNAYSRSDA